MPIVNPELLKKCQEDGQKYQEEKAKKMSSKSIPADLPPKKPKDKKEK